MTAIPNPEEGEDFNVYMVQKSYRVRFTIAPKGKVVEHDGLAWHER